MLEPFANHLPEFGFTLQNYANNANRHTVPDPFDMAK